MRTSLFLPTACIFCVTLTACATPSQPDANDANSLQKEADAVGQHWGMWVPEDATIHTVNEDHIITMRFEVPKSSDQVQQEIEQYYTSLGFPLQTSGWSQTTKIASTWKERNGGPIANGGTAQKATFGTVPSAYRVTYASVSPERTFVETWITNNQEQSGINGMQKSLNEQEKEFRKFIEAQDIWAPAHLQDPKFLVTKDGSLTLRYKTSQSQKNMKANYSANMKKSGYTVQWKEINQDSSEFARMQSILREDPLAETTIYTGQFTRDETLLNIVLYTISNSQVQVQIIGQL